MPSRELIQARQRFPRRWWIALAVGAAAVLAVGIWTAIQRHSGTYRLRHTVTLWRNPRPDGASSFGSFPIAFSRDGRLVAVADCDERIIVVNPSTGDRIGSLWAGVDSEATDSYVFSHDGQSVIAAGSAGRVFVWDVAAQDMIRSFRLTDEPVIVEHDSSWGSTTSHPCFGVMISKDGSRVVSGHRGESVIRVWNVDTGETEVTIAGIGEQFPQSVSATGNLLALHDGNGQLSIWDVSQAPASRLVDIDTDWAGTGRAVFSQHERLLATAAWHEVKLWDCRDGTFLGTLSPAGSTLPDVNVDSLAFCLDDQVLVTGTQWSVDPWWTAVTGPSWLFKERRGCVQFWDVATGEELESVYMKSDVGDIAVSPDGRRLAVGSWYGTLSIWKSTSILLPQSTQ